MSARAIDDDAAAIDARREALWKRLAEIDAEIAKAEHTRKTGEAAVESVATEFIERLERQRKHAIRTCERAAREINLCEERKAANGDLLFEVTKTKLDAWKKVVKNCEESWNVEVRKLDEQVRDAVRGVIGANVIVSPSRPLPDKDIMVDEKPPREALTLPGTGELVLRFWGTHKDTSILPAALIGFGYFAFVTPWSEGMAKILAVAGTGIMLPVLIWLGVAAAEKERRKLVREKREAHERAVAEFVTEDLTETLDEHRDALKRWVSSRAEVWRTAVVAHCEEARESECKRMRDKLQDLSFERRRIAEREWQLAERKRKLCED